MAGAGEEETEYESDPEEAKISLKMRRREASDDEDEREDGENPTVVSEGDESDGQGGADDYDEEYEDEYYDEQQEEVVEEREIGVEREIGGEGGGTKAVEEMAGNGEEIGEDQEQGEEVEEKKENEPFAVPTSGAFYMHDDRFRDNAAGKNRRTFGGRKLWESKDVRKWGHDKFEEMNIPDRHYEEGRMMSKGNYRGRGKVRGAERGYARGSRMRGYGGSNNQNAAPMDVKGRGPRRYQPSMKNKSEVLPPQNKQSAKSLDRTSYTGSVRVAASTINPNESQESVPAKKVASNLNSASPPFYPSGSSKNEVTMTQKKETQASHNRNIRPSSMDRNFPIAHSNYVLRGKNVIGSVGMDKLHIDDSVSPATAKPFNNLHLPSSASPPLSATQMPPSRGDDGRGIALSSVFQPSQTNNQVKKVPTSATQAPQKTPAHNRAQPSLQPSVQYVGQRPLGVSQGLSLPKEGKGTVQGAGTGSLVYGGAQVMGSGGNMVAGHGDQNLPAFFPVMQFGGQHPRGVGVPAVGMAFPGYVAQPNSLGNSEMTWLPVLASAAGALGATYCPPYIAVDGINHPRPTGQTSALPAPSKDNHPSKPDNELKPQQRSELVNHEFSQRQNKPRRYSEMSFSQ